MSNDTNQELDSETADLASQLELESEGGKKQPEDKVETDKPESKEEPKAPEGEKPEEGQKPEGEQKPVDEKTPENPNPDDKPQETEEERKERNRRFYEQRQQERQQQQRQVEKVIDQHYKPQQVDQLAQKYLDQGYDEFQAQMLAREERREQEAQINTVRTEVAELNMQIETESLQVMHDFPVFDPNSDQYDKEFANRASALYQQAAGVVEDRTTGLIVQASISPYNFYKNLAEMRSSGVAKAEVKGQKAAQQQMASVTPPPSNTPPVNKSKEDQEAEDLESALNNVV